jgi:hypothetical protein
MAIRRSPSFPFQNPSSVKPGAVQIGHPCGFIATAGYLRSRPNKSRFVASYLAADAGVGGDTWNFASFADMLETMRLEGCALSRDARLVVGRWVRAGRPAPWLARAAGLSDMAVSSLTPADCRANGWVVSR